VSINDSVNAAQLAARIMAISDARIRNRLEEHLANQTASVLEEDERMDREGLDAYDSET
jgi:phosphoribosylaminoimidazole carboxylase